MIQIFDEVLKCLKLRRLIKLGGGSIIYLDKGYFSYDCYRIGINNYKIIPVIFPKKILKLQKLKDQMVYPLEIYKSKAVITNRKNFRTPRKAIDNKIGELEIF